LKPLLVLRLITDGFHNPHPEQWENLLVLLLLLFLITPKPRLE
jgi:hypothetical protein